MLVLPLFYFYRPNTFALIYFRFDNADGRLTSVTFYWDSFIYIVLQSKPLTKNIIGRIATSTFLTLLGG